jgi:hypothetical protein
VVLGLRAPPVVDGQWIIRGHGVDPDYRGLRTTPASGAPPERSAVGARLRAVAEVMKAMATQAATTLPAAAGGYDQDPETP